MELTDEQMKRQMDFEVACSCLERLLEMGLLDRDEFEDALDEIIGKYHPIIEHISLLYQ